MAVLLLTACGVKNVPSAIKEEPLELQDIIGTWADPDGNRMYVRSLTFHEDSRVVYLEIPDTTWPIHDDSGGMYAEMEYEMIDTTICFLGIDEIGLTFKYTTHYRIDNKTLSLDSFSYDGGHRAVFVKPLILKKR